MKSIKVILYVFITTALFNACTKEYSIEGGGLKVPTGTWEFADSLRQFEGNIDTAYITSSGGTKDLQLIGTSADGFQTFHMHLYADTFTTGMYKASLFQSSFEYSIPAKTLYEADQLVGEFIVNITSVTANYISGTFSGAALDSGNNIKNLKAGKFTSTIGKRIPTSPSSGVLGDSAGNCKPVIVSGAYAPGTALTAANTVQVQVTVTTPGTYSVASNTINGVTFSKAGTFTSTGIQTLTLIGSGTPVNTGTQNFAISYSNSLCGFAVDF